MCADIISKGQLNIPNDQMDRKSDRLSSKEFEIVQELVNEAMTKAVRSMELMLKIRVKAEHVTFGKGSLEYIPEFDTLGRFKVHLVKVGFNGDLHGTFYFIINSHEVDLINQVCLPQNIISDNRTENKQMMHGFMSEIENMIAAQSIREISEFLGVQLLGEVPEVNIMQGDKVNEYLDRENELNQTAFYVSAVLSGVVVNISPYFIWMLDQSFLKKLRDNIVL